MPSYNANTIFISGSVVDCSPALFHATRLAGMSTTLHFLPAAFARACSAHTLRGMNTKRGARHSAPKVRSSELHPCAGQNCLRLNDVATDWDLSLLSTSCG